MKRVQVRPTTLEVTGHAHPDDDTWIVHFRWPTNPLPMNGSRGASWQGAAAKARRVRSHAQTLIEYVARVPELGRCRALVTWWVQTNHVRDPDNLGLLEKRLFDAIVRAGVVEDDRPALMVKDRAEIRHVKDSAGLVSAAGFTLTITRLPETPGS